MFIGFSKTIAKFGGFKLGVGMRLNKKNAIWVSMIALFVVMFKLMWYALVLCGWLMYAFFYCIYWCFKALFGLSSRKQKTNSTNMTDKKTVTKNKSEEENEDNKSEIINSDNESSNDLKTKPTQEKSTIIRWAIGGLFVAFALVNGFHYSSLFLIAAAFLMFPFQFVSLFLQKKNIKSIVAIVLSVVLLFVGAMTSPTPEPTEPESGYNNQLQTEQKNDETTSNDETTEQLIDTTYDEETTEQFIDTTFAEEIMPVPAVSDFIEETTEEPVDVTFEDETTDFPGTTFIEETTSAPTETTFIIENPEVPATETTEKKVTMVWISSSGKKYHSKSNCSNMSSPTQVSLEIAKIQGYEPCKKCH